MRRLRQIACALAAVLIGTVTANAAGPSDAASELAFAAREFARYHEAITGRPAPAARFAVDTSLDAAHDEYRIVSEGEAVAFLGANGRAVQYAVYDFLERRGGCRWFWDGDRVPKRASLDFSGLDVREKARFEYRAIRYFAHRGLTRFQAEHWGFADWCREIDWCVKRRLNVIMPRLGAEDLFPTAFPGVVPWPDPAAKAELAGFDNRAASWPLEYRADLRRRIRDYAYSRGLIVPEDFGTMTHWYSRTPRAFLDKMKPDFLPQEGGNYREDSGRVWDVRQPRWLDAYFRLTEAQIARGAKSDYLHTIGLGERMAYTNRAENLKLKIDVLSRLLAGARRRWPRSKVFLAGWDFFGGWRPPEIAALVKTLDPEQVVFWDYEGDSAIKYYGNVTEWGLKGRFPYTYGFFVNSAAGCDIRAQFDFIERRGRELVDDPFCRGFVLWPEASHIDPFLLEWFTVNAWRPFADRSALLSEFCRGRYGDAAAKVEAVWRDVLAFPQDPFSCWGGNCANREPGDIVTFSKELNDVDARCWNIARELPRYARAPAVFRALAALPLADDPVRRDAIDLARTTADRLLERARAELVTLFADWRRTGDARLRVRTGAVADIYKSLGRRFADLLEQHTDYSIVETIERMEEVRAIENPDWLRVHLDNATCGYCRSHQYETARFWYQRCCDDLAAAVKAKVRADDRTPLDVERLAANRYREELLASDRATIRPEAPRTADELRRILRTLAAEADVLLAAPPCGAAKLPPDWLGRGASVAAPVDAAQTAPLVALGFASSFAVSSDKVTFASLATNATFAVPIKEAMGCSGLRGEVRGNRVAATAPAREVFLAFMRAGVPMVEGDPLSADAARRELFRRLNALRADDPTLSDGGELALGNSAGGGVASFVRQDGRGRVLVLVNSTDRERRFRVHNDIPGDPDFKASALRMRLDGGFRAEGDEYVLEPFGYMAGDILTQ